jgi:hypothetical protein
MAVLHLLGKSNQSALGAVFVPLCWDERRPGIAINIIRSYSYSFLVCPLTA